jgi:hypothetical protein
MLFFKYIAIFLTVLKGPCIQELLDGIDFIANDQFGNWCISNICQGRTKYRHTAIEHIIQNAYHYSIGEYAHYVVLIGMDDEEFKHKYLDRISKIPYWAISRNRYSCKLLRYIPTRGLELGSPLGRILVD